MEVIIIEDEKPAREKLKKMLSNIDPEIKVLAELTSIKQTLNWISLNEKADLVFLDIQLTDGLSLEIFKQSKFQCPVVFTTAFDEYILQAFDYNSIDYLLKPIKKEKLESALKKYADLKTHFTNDFYQLLKQWQPNSKKYKERIMAKKGIEYVSVPTSQIAYFFAEHKLIFLIDKSGKRYLVDKTIQELEEEFNPNEFFRLNRKYFSRIEAITHFRPDYKSKLLVELVPKTAEEVFVSQEKAAEFREWMER